MAEPNREPPALPNSPPGAVVVPAAVWGAVVAPPKRPPVVAAWVVAAGAAGVAAVLLPNRPDVPEGVAAPEAGVEVLPNMFPAGLAAPPNKPPPDEAPVVWPKSDVPVAGAADEGVVAVPALPNNPPAGAGVAPAPPNKPPPAWGVLVPLAAGLKEKGDAVEPAAAPNRPPEAAADVVGCPEAAFAAGGPKLKDILAAGMRWVG